MKEPITGATSSSSQEWWDQLEAFARGHIPRWVQALLEEEVTTRLGRKQAERRAGGRGAEGYRNGYGRPRRLTMSGGTITVRRPRVWGLAERCVSRVLPLCKRRTKEVGERWPQWSWHGLAHGDVELALRGLLGEGAPRSAASLQRLNTPWQQEDEAWQPCRLDALEVVYAWADGLYVQAGLEDRKAALLVLGGALTDGRKVVLAGESGQRESKESWGAVLPGTRLAGVRARGLKPWRGPVADGHRGIGAA